MFELERMNVLHIEIPSTVLKYFKKCCSKFVNLTGLILDLYTHAPVNLPSLVQIMACHLVGAEPLSEPMLEYC